MKTKKLSKIYWIGTCPNCDHETVQMDPAPVGSVHGPCLKISGHSPNGVFDLSPVMYRWVKRLLPKPMKYADGMRYAQNKLEGVL